MGQVIISVGLFVFLSTCDVFAATGDAPTHPAAGAGIFVAFAIAYVSRRRSIGGWLLYYYLQLYFSFLISFVFVPQLLSNLSPSNWEDSLLYVMFLLSVVPVMAIQLLEVVVATILLFRRSEQNLKILRKTLIALVVTSAIAVPIDITYFGDTLNIFLDVITLVFAVIWLLYFSISRRVKMVFISRNWIYKTYSERRALSSEDKKKLNKRAIISSSIIFVLFFIMMGFENKGEQPDIDLIAVPLFYAVVTFIIAWYLPIRKK